MRGDVQRDSHVYVSTAVGCIHADWRRARECEIWTARDLNVLLDAMMTAPKLRLDQNEDARPPCIWQAHRGAEPEPPN
jgi:hypothetical protein